MSRRQWVIADDEGVVGYAPALCLALYEVRRQHGGNASPYGKQKMQAGDYAVYTADGQTLYLMREDVAERYASESGWPYDKRLLAELADTEPRP